MVTLRNGGSIARIDRIGAYIDSLQLNGKQILMNSPDGRETHGGCAVLIPFANRVRNGTYVWQGRTYSLPKNDGLNSIHGLVRHEKWEYAREDATDDNETALKFRLASAGYPSVIEVMNTYEIGEEFFNVTTSIKNAGDNSSPLVVGFHPYFLFNGNWGLRHSEELSMLHYRDRYFPDGTMEKVDFNDDKGIQQRTLDSCFLGGGDLTFSAGNYSLKIIRRNMDYFVIYNGQFSYGRSVAIEPMTGAPDAFNNHIGVKDLAPGDTFECGFRIELVEE